MGKIVSAEKFTTLGQVRRSESVKFEMFKSSWNQTWTIGQYLTLQCQYEVKDVDCTPR